MGHAEPSAATLSPGRSWRDSLTARLLPGSRVVLPEGDDPRVRTAANKLLAYGITPMLLTEPSPTCSGPTELPVPLEHAVECVDADTLAGGVVGRWVAQHLGRGWASRQPQGSRHPLLLAAALVATGAADAAVAGSRHPTADVLRSALAMIGLSASVTTLSSCFLLRRPDGRIIAFADCAVVPEPTAGELADIAIATAETFSRVTNQAPVIAMLSFSTLGSADHHSVRLVRDATVQVHQRAPWLAADGELQFDAAMDESVARQKAPRSRIAGRANIFVFPNLAAANIGYKIAQRMGGADAIGPIIQGLKSPMNDLSRGCSAEDIVDVALVSALQAHTEDGLTASARAFSSAQTTGKPAAPI